MYLRYTTRKKDGKTHRYWRLVQSVRVGRRVIQQTVAQLGELDAEGRLQARTRACRLIGAPEQAALFDDGTDQRTVSIRLKACALSGHDSSAMCIWRSLYGAAWGLRIFVIKCWPRTMSKSPGRRSPRCW